MRRIRPDRQLPWSYRFVAALLRMLMQPLTRRDWRGAEHLPRGRGFVVSPNHLSYFDPLAFAHFLVRQRAPAVLPGQGERLSHPVARPDDLRDAEQIPVYREHRRRPTPSGPRSRRCESGKCVAIYPEGTLTRDPDLWPMTGKTGAARVALDHRVPGDPGGAVGPAGDPRAVPQAPAPAAAQDDARARRPPGRPRRPATAKPIDRAVLREATARIMAAITALLEQIRGEHGPGRALRPAGPGSPRPATTSHDAARPRRRPRLRGEDPMTTRSRLRHRQLGDGLRRGARRRRGRRHACGAAAPRSSTRSTHGTSTRDYLPDLALPQPIPATTDPAEAVDGADIVVLAVPSQTLRANLAAWGRLLPADARRRLA